MWTRVQMTEAYKMIGSVQAFNFGDTLATKVGKFFWKVFVRWWACLQHSLIDCGLAQFHSLYLATAGHGKFHSFPNPSNPLLQYRQLSFSSSKLEVTSFGSQLLTHFSLSSLFGLLSTADYYNGYEVKPLQCQDAAAATVSHRTWTIAEQKWSVLFFLLHFFTPLPTFLWLV